MKRNEAPAQGPLQGLRVAHCSLSVAGPFAAQMMADLGADVIWIENPRMPDIARDLDGKGRAVDLDRRNQRTISLNVPTAEGSDVFARLLVDLDIFIEASKPGQYEKWGWSDERMWEINPKLVIAHISGYGQSGDARYAGRASYDPIAQAFGGLMAMNGTPQMQSFPAMWAVADYYTGMFTAFTCLAAHLRAKQTGQGESIDSAQYEIVARTLGTFGMDSWNTGVPYVKKLVNNGNTAGYNTYRCADGNEVFMLLLGGGVMKAGVPLFGLEYGGEDFPENCWKVNTDSPAGIKLEAAIAGFCGQHPAQEVEDILSAASVPCGCIVRVEDMPSNAQYVARDTFVEYQSETSGVPVKAIDVVPKLKNNPGKVWRGGPRIGQDTADILCEIGYSAEEIERLGESKAVRIGR